ncbi:hypothetical protein FRC12_024726 [Ceratobasidium sp. 428]|nr:hypothetical protein FRC12_024726 [Ceratobasidium sp. 428]
MSNDDLTLVERESKTILVVIRESQSWLYRWHTWVDQSNPRKQLVKDIVIDTDKDERRRASLISQSPAQEAFQFVVNAYNHDDIVCVFGFGEKGSMASLELAHLLHSNFTADLCSYAGAKECYASGEESGIVQCVAVNCEKEAAPLTLLYNTIKSLPSSIPRVICTNEDGTNMFTCSATLGRNARIQPKEVWRFDCAPAWRTNRHWLIKQTADLIHYIPMHVKNWFDTTPRSTRCLEKPQTLIDRRKSGPEAEALIFGAHRTHDDHIINILDDDEFDLRYQVWTL